ncbi:MAG: hypothetical protein LIO69_08555 [Oscillospiraceae bacterium]|nr:hypothetical protein [Oscillospiraceae bacterium]
MEAAAETTQAVQTAGETVMSILPNIFLGVLALALIWLVAEFSPKIAAWVDSLLGRGGKKDNSSEKKSDGLYDIYEGENNLTEDDPNSDNTRKSQDEG